MMDGERMRQAVRRGKVLRCVLVNMVVLLPSLYGFKCVLTGQGALVEPGKYVMRSFRLSPVEGKAAILAGLGYIALGLFGFLSVPGLGNDSSWRWRVVIGIIRWGSLLAMFFLLSAARDLKQ